MYTLSELEYFSASLMLGRRPKIYAVANGRTSHFVEEVKRWCRQNKVSQAELARRLGVSRALVTEWFKGRRFPVGEQILHLQELMRK